MYLLHQVDSLCSRQKLAPLNIIYSSKQIENGCEGPYLNSGYRLDVLLLPVTHYLGTFVQDNCN